MTDVVTFNPVAWAAMFPELAYIDPVSAQMYFDLAVLYCDNSPTSRIRPVTTRATILNMLTAHVASLLAPKENGQPASPLVGRISDATQGSVSVSTQNDYKPGTVQWYQQTKYGSMAWAAMQIFKTFAYVPGCNSGGPVWPRGALGPRF